MPVIRDGETPLGRILPCKPAENHVGECVARKMTPEEWEHYGEPVPPGEWHKPPKYTKVVEGKPKSRKMSFKDEDDFRRMIKRERLQRNMTQERVAMFAQMSTSEYSKLERGAKKLTPARRKKICDVYGWEEE